MKIAINCNAGEFCLSKKAYEYMGIPWDNEGWYENGERTDPKLIDCIENLGEQANGWFARLKVIEIPDNIDYRIINFDGFETVVEEGHYWS